MAVFRIAALGACLVAGVCALPARASSGSDGASCVAVSDDAARLACYDRAYGRNAASKSAATAAAAAATVAAVVAPQSPSVASPTAVVRLPRSATPKDPVAEFGLTETAKQAKDPTKAPRRRGADERDGQGHQRPIQEIRRIRRHPDNAQVWEQNEPMPSAIVRVGDTVTVKKAVLGAQYTLVTPARVATKVHRVD